MIVHTMHFSVLKTKCYQKHIIHNMLRVYHDVV